MSNANKNKGKSLEREIAKELTEVFQLNFERIWSSGAFVGGKNSFRLQKLTKEQSLLSSGDILVPIELSHISIEAKFYKDFSFNSLFENNELLNGWISQASNDTSKLWFIIFKINGKGKFVVFDAKDLSKFIVDENYLRYKKSYVITSYDGFFTKNKDNLLNYTQCSDSKNTTTIPLSTSTV